MASLTREAIHRVLGPIDDTLAAELAATGASEEELAEAQAWVMSDDALMSDLRPLPKGRVAQLVDILAQLEGPASEED
ncbi:MAG: hypothetical protein ACRED5_03410 [Propylenella sp.]